MEELFLPGTQPRKTCAYHGRRRIDRRNGLLAGPRCPRHVTRLTREPMYPPAFASWAKFHGIPHAPTGYSPHCPKGAGGVAIDGRPAVVFPIDGARYLIDPARPRQYQALPLKVALPAHVAQVTWLIDGRPHRSTPWPYTAHWRLRAGPHVVQVIADGQRSAPVRFSVQ